MLAHTLLITAHPTGRSHVAVRSAFWYDAGLWSTDHYTEANQLKYEVMLRYQDGDGIKSWMNDILATRGQCSKLWTQHVTEWTCYDRQAEQFQTWHNISIYWIWCVSGHPVNRSPVFIFLFALFCSPPATEKCVHLAGKSSIMYNSYYGESTVNEKSHRSHTFLENFSFFKWSFELCSVLNYPIVPSFP